MKAGSRKRDLSAARFGFVFLPTAVCLLLTVFCLTAFSQPGGPGPSSPLYGARPQSGVVSNGLPKALQDVKIDQKLNEQLPLELVFRNEKGEPVKLGDYFGKKPVMHLAGLLRMPDALYAGVEWDG